MAVNKTDAPPPIPRSVMSIGVKASPPAPEPLADLGVPPVDTSWLPPAGLSRAATVPFSSRPPAPGAAAPIDADFPHLQPNSAPSRELRDTLRTMLGQAAGADPLGPNSPALQQAIDRLAPALSHTTRAEAEKLITAELKQLAPDAKALEAILHKEGFKGVGGMTKGAPTAEAFASAIAQRISRSMPLAEVAIAKDVISQARNAVVEKAPAALKSAFRSAMSADELGLTTHGFPSRTSMVNDLCTAMADRLANAKPPIAAPPGAVRALAEKGADAILETNVKGLMVRGFTEESARAFTVSPGIAQAGKAVSRAVNPNAAGAAVYHLEDFFAKEAKDGFLNLEKNLVAEMKMTPELAKATAAKAKALFPAELAKQRVPSAVMASIEARVVGPKSPLSNPEGAAKVASWGEKLMAHVPPKVVEMATSAVEAGQKLAAASPMLTKAAPYVARVIPYVNTPVAGLTMAHAVDVHNDPEAWKVEEALAHAAAVLNVAAAGAAYAPVPVLDWAASFAGGALSLGVSGLEWGTSALRKSIAPAKP